MLNKGRWTLLALTVGACVTMGAGLVACKETPKGDLPVPPSEELQSYYPSSVMNAEKKLLVLGGYGVDNAGRHKFITAEAIQGFLNRETVNVYVDYPIETEGVSSSHYWLEKTADYGVTTEEKTLSEAVELYKEWAGDNAGYILYSDETDAAVGLDRTRSLTAATDMAAIRGWLPVDESLKDTAEAEWGLTMKLDVSDKDEMWVFENYRDEFDNSILVQQRPVEVAGLPMVPLRDFAICYKYFMFYEEGTTGSATRQRTAIHEWAKSSMPIFGWGPGDEATHIGFASKNGQFPIPSDFSCNLTVMNADVFKKETVTQKNAFVPVTPEEGKHYVAFGRSDGDNISVWANTFPLSSTDIKGAAEGTFPMGWSLSPSLAEISPLMLNAIYEDASENDYFIAPVSGHGYIYPSAYPEEYRSEWIAQMDRYLGMADLHVAEILDIGKGDILAKDIANAYAAAENLKGGICLNGNRYAGGQGAVIWSENGKPFLHPRETLWTNVKEMVAARINSYHKDYTRIEGYTFVNLHPWSHTYQDVAWVVDHLDEDVVVISPEQMIDMISKYVPHTDRTTLENSGEELRLPIDPLENKFLMGTEDWKAGGSSEIKASDGTLTINGTASKTYTLPDQDDLFVTFNYKPVGGKSASFDVSLEIGEKSVLVAQNYPVTGDDGLCTFQIPYALYFTREEYGGKEATLTLTTNGEVAISEVATYSKTCADKTSAGDLLNDTFTQGTLEDWYFGGRFTETGGHEKGGTVKLDNNRLMFDGSDGWTGLYNNNVNTSAVKYFTMPNWENATAEFTLQSSDRGTLLNVIMVVGGKVVPVTDGWFYVSESRSYTIRSVVKGAAQQPAVVLVMQRDSKQNNGIGEAGFVCSMNISEYAVDPLNNVFEIDLEDWTGTSVEAKDGYAQFTGTASMQKTITVPSLEGNWKTTFALTYKTVGAVEYKVSVQADGEDVLLDWKSVNAADAVTDVLKEGTLCFAGKETTIVIETRGEGTFLLDSFTVGKDWAYDPYNNQFETDREDWTVKSTVGWESNGATKDPNWPRLQVTYNDLGQSDPGGKAVLSKIYTLPSNRLITLSIDLELLGEADIKLSVVIEGQTHLLLTLGSSEDVGRKTHSVSLAEKLQDVEYAGKEVEILFEFTATSANMDAFLWSFVTTTAEYDPYNNQFENGLEDWTVKSTVGWESNGATKDPNWPRLQIAFNDLGQPDPGGKAVLSKKYTLPASTSVTLTLDLELLGEADIKLSIVIDGETHELLTLGSSGDVGRKTHSVSLAEKLQDVEYAGKEVEILLEFTATSASMDAYLWSFVTA